MPEINPGFTEEGANGGEIQIKPESALGALNVAAEKSRREKSAALKNFAAQAAKSYKGHKDLDSIIRFQGGSHANANPEYQHQEWERYNQELNDLGSQIRAQTSLIESQEAELKKSLLELEINDPESHDLAQAATAEIQKGKEVLTEMKKKLNELNVKIRYDLVERQKKSQQEQEAVSRDYKKFVIDEFLKIVENPKAFTEGVDENELEESIGPDLTRLIKSQAPLLKGVSRQELERALDEEFEGLKDKNTWDDETEFIDNIRTEFAKLQQELLEQLAEKEAFMHRQTPESQKVFGQWDIDLAEAKNLLEEKLWFNKEERTQIARRQASELIQAVRSSLDEFINSLIDINNRMTTLFADATLNKNGQRFLPHPRNMYTQRSLSSASGYSDTAKVKAMEVEKANLKNGIIEARADLDSKIQALYAEVSKYKKEKGL